MKLLRATRFEAPAKKRKYKNPRLTELMLEVLDTIPINERNDPAQRNYRVIADILGCKWQYVWQVEKRALRKMHREAQRRQTRERLMIG